MPENDFEISCFDGDLGDMNLAARRVAIRLKMGRPILAATSDDFEKLMDWRDDVERSLNNDLLSLWVDDRNKVAWAEPVQDIEESPILRRGVVRENDLCLLIVLFEVVAESRSGGGDDVDGWYELIDVVRNRYLELNPRLRKETRGGKVERGFAKAIERAEGRYWLKRVDQKRLLILPTVASLMDHGFLDAAIEACTASGPAEVEDEEDEDD